MPEAAAIRRVALLSAALLLVRIASAAVVTQPGYTDAYYYADVASRLARGEGLSADFVWNFLEAPGYASLPVASHRFWMPLATAIQASGIVLLGPALGDFRASQAAIIAVAALVPAATYAAARALGVASGGAIAAAAVVGLGGLFAPAWVSLDAFAPAALVGTLFFTAYGRAAAGSVRYGAVAGVLVGILYLARAEGALFGLALLALFGAGRSRRAAATGAVAALAIGGAWLARDLAVSLPPDLAARTVLLVRYEDFFAVASPSLAAFGAALGEALAAKPAAMLTNALTAFFAFLVLLGPVAAAGTGWLWRRPEVRAWAGLLAIVFVAESVVWTLHSTRGSYFHSLAAFFPFGVALAAAGGERLLAGRGTALARAWTAGALLVSVVLSAGAMAQWDATFGAGARARTAVLDALPAGPFLAIDGAAWRWLSGRSAIVTPADGVGAAACAVARYGVRALVLEEAHFRAYDDLYSGRARPSWLGEPVVRGAVRVYPITASPPVADCAAAR